MDRDWMDELYERSERGRKSEKTVFYHGRWTYCIPIESSVLRVVYAVGRNFLFLSQECA